MYESASFCRQIETGLTVSTPTVVTPYAGPGNVITGAVAWWGLRAYTSASIGGNAVRLREDGGNTEQDFATVAGGGLNLSLISSFKGAANLFVTTLYDQTGNANDQVQATAARQPGFTLSGLGALPIMTFSRASNQYLETASNFTQSQPFCFAGVSLYTNAGLQSPFISQVGGLAQLSHNLFHANPNAAFIFAGTGLQATATDGNWHALEALFNDTSSKLMVDGATSTGTAGATTLTAPICIGTDNASTNFHNGNAVEGGVWPGDVSANFASHDSNAHAYWLF